MQISIFKFIHMLLQQEEEIFVPEFMPNVMHEYLNHFISVDLDVNALIHRHLKTLLKTNWNEARLVPSKKPIKEWEGETESGGWITQLTGWNKNPSPKLLVLLLIKCFVCSQSHLLKPYRVGVYS